jgi:hypothetical protein
MRSQVRKVQYNHAADACQNDYHITETCEQAFSYGDFNYFAKVGQCKADLIAKCQQNASAEYLRRNNAKKLNIRLHDYNHNYNHNQP